ncbi:helix-turn-helix domain-containing protein [Streptomyces beigongshangae]|uniref:helix-turn-helix domain-containing protein n=1 Tax=Streptomyces beigongshangae TaxID=2841597 RepID=UPI003221E623
MTGSCHARTKGPDPSPSPRTPPGAELRHAREQAGFSQDEPGNAPFAGGSSIGQLEAGTRRVQPDMATKLDEILKTTGFFERNRRAVNRSRYPDHCTEAAEAAAPSAPRRPTARRRPTGDPWAAHG